MSVNTATRVEMLRQETSCVKCGSSEALQIDHVWPESMGGRDEGANLQVLCRRCNLAKGTHILKSDLLKAEWSRLNELVDLKRWGQELADAEIKILQWEMRLWREMAQALANRVLAERAVKERQQGLDLANRQYQKMDGKISTLLSDLRDHGGIDTKEGRDHIAEALGFVLPGESAPPAVEVARRRLLLL